MANLAFLRNKWVWLGVLLLFAAVLTVVLPYWRPHYWSTRSMLIAATTSIRQRGEPVAFADLVAESPDAYATGDRVLAIVSRFTEPDDEFYDLMRADPPTPPGNYAALGETIRTNRDALDALAAINAADECRFRYDFAAANPMSTLLPGVDGLNKAGHLWRAEFLQSLGTGDGDRAVRATVGLLDTPELLRREPFLVSQHARIRLGGNAVDVLQVLLARIDLTPEQFQDIDRRLADMESTYRLAGTIYAERAAMFTTMENIGHPAVRKSLGMMAGLGPGGAVFDLSPGDFLLNRWASLSYRPERLRQQVWMLETMTRLAKLVDVPGTKAERQWQQDTDEIIAFLKSKENALVSLLFPAIIDVRNMGLTYRQRLIAARLALRVDRHRMARGNPPKNLDDVLDDSMPEVPAGLVTGHPPQYKVRPGGFMIGEPIKTDDGERADLVEVDYETTPSSR